jgi:hypothetical protein
VAALLAFGAPLSASAEVVGDGPGAISGIVSLADGSPLAGIPVSVSIPAGEGSSFGASTITDATGAYEFSGLDAATYYLQPTAFGYQQPAGETLTLTVESATAVVNFTVQPFSVGLGTISGHATANGVGLPNITVSAINNATAQNLYATTDETGYFEFSEVSNGDWWVNSYPGGEYQFNPGLTVTLSDTELTATADLEFELWPVGTATISGTVTDSATGLPVAYVSVQLTGIDVAHQSFTSTDETGAFSVELLPAGNYTLSYWAPGYLNSTAQVQAISDATVTVTPALVPVNAAIHGHVKSTDGTPIAGVYVDAHTSDGSFGFAETDENGDYVITELGAVEYTLTIGGVGTLYKLKTKTVTAVANGSAKANFTLKDRTTGSIGGFVLASGGSDYTAPVCATLYSATKKNPIASVVTFGPDFGDGSYTFDSVKPGTYTVAFADCDSDPVTAFDTAFLGGAAAKADAVFVTVVAGEDSWGNDFTVEARSTTSTINGHVEKGNGTPLAGLVVQATDGIASSASAVTDANGDYTLTGLFADSYTVTVGGVATPYALKQKTVTTIADGVVTADFTLHKR